MPLNEPSAAERYLQDFHQRTAGSTTAAFGGLPATTDGTTYASSYHLLASLIPAHRGALTVVDLACGDGPLLALLSARADADLKLVGVDMSQGELDAARAKLPGHVSLLKERAQALSLETGSVDYVLSHMALMLMDDIDRVFSEIHRVLRPGGTLAFIVGRAFLSGPVKQVYLDVLRPVVHEEGAHVRFGDLRMQSEAGWRSLLAQAFCDVGCQDVDVSWHPTPEEFWESLSTTYDVDRLSPKGRGMLRERLLPALAAVQDDDGRIRTGWSQRLITARAA
ncbi:class I SAM-dependent methyltransferase [Paraburkholderia sp. DHOC27]|nr:class I SAM-dependent methyltransferase [Paraburkholderia sp. DHOC27]